MHVTNVFKKGNTQAFRTPADLAFERQESYGCLRDHRETVFAPAVLRQA